MTEIPSDSAYFISMGYKMNPGHKKSRVPIKIPLISKCFTL